MIRMDLYIGSLTLHTAERLVYHDLAVGKCKALAARAAGKQKRAHGRCHTYAGGGNVAFDKVHGVIYRKTCGNASSGAVDIQAYILVGVLCLKEQKLCYHKGSGYIVDLIGKKYYTVIEQAGVYVICSFASAGLFDNGWYKCHSVDSFHILQKNAKNSR